MIYYAARLGYWEDAPLTQAIEVPRGWGILRLGANYFVEMAGSRPRRPALYADFALALQAASQACRDLAEAAPTLLRVSCGIRKRPEAVPHTMLPELQEISIRA